MNEPNAKPNAKPSAKPRDASSRFLWPPTIYASAALLAWGLGHVWPLALPLSEAARWFGWGLLALAGLIAGAAELSFLRAGTATLPTSPTTTIVETGVFRYSRNPIYLAMTIALAALGLVFASAWFFVVAPAAVVAVVKLAIEREEAYLARKFGAPYLAYMTRVRRWL